MSRQGWCIIAATALFLVDAILAFVGGGQPYILPIAFLGSMFFAAGHLP